jgi:hypothetical protein
MIVSIAGPSCYVYRESGDPVFRPNRSKNSWSPPGWYAAESRLLYAIKKILNGRGYDLLKKRMWKDGHMFGFEESQYIRSRDLKNVPSMYIYHANAALEVAAESFNVLGRVELDVTYGAGREDDPGFGDECREWVESTGAALPCYEVSWEAVATIDGNTAVRRLYRGFNDIGQASAYFETDPGYSCRLIDRRSVKPIAVLELA